ncbi:Sec1p KNAG_0A05000 [Huiozyma naganishii CBS 8797]|uniref:Sec1-like protein n=1 Tax=Huiozyma naganishii (strain ATCC MYA-139 / BCRC 22969 / CBS 8797 / KCTC 17520 / NBRC 10181 / NCYC 3082 / Yp74L-3) TaxID=1071383 RepID=J7RF31_HUIN7|nr:hypothetical protein KNAG_0A05000 [Kazachstania naganishii CBS 8797]CCK68168.1 hypothetical protein KNAG_0A05000 [Kazachstania naganishii CBS 8797]
MPNLIELQRDHVVSILNAVVASNSIKFLVVDEFVEKLLEYIFESPNELLKYVTSVDRIDSPKRQGQQSVDVIYLLQPTKFNMKCMDADFQSIPPKYKTPHIRFLAPSEKHVVTYFSSLKYITRYMQNVSEVNLSFIPKEAQYFQTIGTDKPLQIFFNPNCLDLIEKHVSKAMSSLLNLCIITGEYPIIRYSKATESQLELSQASRLAEKLAKNFQYKLDEYARSHEDFPPPSTRPRAILVVTDRTLDQFSPILHDFSYQAMAYDVVPDIDVRTDIYHYTAENEKGDQEAKESELTDLKDPDWVELRHQHIISANEYLAGKIKEMIAKNPLLVDRSKVKNTTDLLSVVAHLKDFDEERRRMVLHKILIEECLSINQKRKLAELAEVEQNLAGFGFDINGEKSRHITDSLLRALLSRDTDITDRVRYIIIYALYRGGLIEDDFKKLLSFAAITEEHDYFDRFLTLFKNFNFIGFRLIKEQPKDKPFQKEWFHDSITKDPSVYTTSRFVPAASNIISKLIANPLLLSEEAFPFVKDKPIEILDEEAKEIADASAGPQTSASLRNPRHRAAWTKTNNVLQSNQPRQRFFFYTIGGITYPEIKAAYDQANLKNRDVFIGSDGILTPSSFMKSIEFVTKPRDFLGLKDDAKEEEDIPSFLLSSLRPVSAPVSHIHKRSEMPQSSRPVIKSAPVEPASPKKEEKKRSKFSRFLRKDKK